MLFRQDVLRRIGEGEVTLAFRRWRRPTVKAGGTLRTRVGVLAIESVEVVDEGEVTDADARRAGAPDREARAPRGPAGRGRSTGSSSGSPGPDPRIALRKRSRISPSPARGDRRAPRPPRRREPARARGRSAVLGLIAERPGTRAPDLAASMGRETAPFKADVRKLKELGLTESLEVGYRLSPRGRAYYGYSGVARKRSRSR